MTPRPSRIREVVEAKLRSILQPQRINLDDYGTVYQRRIPIGHKKDMKWAAGFHCPSEKMSYILPGMTQHRQAVLVIIDVIRLCRQKEAEAAEGAATQAAAQAAAHAAAHTAAHAAVQTAAQAAAHAAALPAAVVHQQLLLPHLHQVPGFDAAAEAVAHIPQHLMQLNLHGAQVLQAPAQNPAQIMLPHLHLPLVPHQQQQQQQQQHVDAEEADQDMAGNLPLCGICMGEFTSSGSYTLQCGHAVHRECTVESIVQCRRGTLPGCVDCVMSITSCDKQIGIPDLVHLAGIDHVKVLMHNVKPSEKWAALPAVILVCSRPGCIGAPLNYSAVYPNHRICTCACGNTICAICLEPLEAHTAFNAPACVPPPIPKFYLDLNAKTCPSCHAVAVDRMGCNCVTCTCGVKFCWLCGMALSAGRPQLPMTQEQAEDHLNHVHSHFWEQAVALPWAGSKPHLPLVWRFNCAGHMDGTPEVDVSYEKVSKQPVFGMAHPHVARGV